MKGQSKYQEIMNEIKEVYAQLPNHLDWIISKNADILNRVRTLPKAFERKECIKFMLLSWLDELFSNSDLDKNAKDDLKVKMLGEVQHLLDIYPEMTKDKEESVVCRSEKSQEFIKSIQDEIPKIKSLEDSYLALVYYASALNKLDSNAATIAIQKVENSIVDISDPSIRAKMLLKLLQFYLEEKKDSEKAKQTIERFTSSLILIENQNVKFKMNEELEKLKSKYNYLLCL